VTIEPGRLLASGRDGDIFEFAPGLVLRRTKAGRVIEREARTMSYAREHGYPVPEIHEVRADGTEIVMERVEGPMMMDAMLRKPWKMGHYARALADLHDRLHVIPAPDWLPDLDGGDRLVHMDLHPMNVMLSPSGPIVIDWTNASRGLALTDVAVTIVLLTCPQMPGSRARNTAVAPARAFLARAFSARYKGRALDERIAWSAPLKSLDKNLSPVEVAACLRLGARARKRAER
jgi:aminoglycoside phosphotransferase (APT) family kinase protein